MQLDIYETYNQQLRVMHSEAHQARISQTESRIDELVQEKTAHLNHAEGESLSTDDYQDIYC